MKILRIDVARGIQWVEVPEAGLRLLCGCPADSVKHLIKRGLIVRREANGVVSETGPNAILLSDLPVQNGELANLAEFPVLQMLYKQGMLVPGHPANSGHKPLLIGSADQVESQMRYIYRGNYGLVSREEIAETGVPAEQAAQMMRMKLAFAFGRIRPTQDFLDACVVGEQPVEIAAGVGLHRLEPNVFRICYDGESVTVDLNLARGESYECPYPLAHLRYEPEYFSVIHSGEGDGWDVNRPSMSSIVTFQGRIYLIDAGPQLAHVLTALGIGIDQIDGIFHTHAHDDHFAGLAVLMRAGRRIDYFATPLVRSSAAKKLTSLLGLEEEGFADFFSIRDLAFDEWNDIEGLEVMPLFSPHPVENNLFVFRTLSGDGYRSYAHFADVASFDVLERMAGAAADQPGLDPALLERARTAYLTPVDVKKIDVGGGMIHGAAADFRDDASKRILLAHRADSLTAAEKEIGSNASFGTTDVLVGGASESLRRVAFGYLEAHLPGVPVHQLRMLLNHPVADVNPGAIILREGETPGDVMLLLSGCVEKIRTRDGLLGSLPVGALLGDQALIDDRPSRHTYRASSFLRVMRLPRSLFLEIVRRNRLEDRRRRVADLASFLDSTNLFGDGLPARVLGRILDGATEHAFAAGEEILNGNLHVLNLIRSGRVERVIGERVLDLLGPRDAFGEEGAVFNVPYLYRLRAVEATEVIQVPRHLIDDVPILRWKLLETQQQRSFRLLHDEHMADRFVWSDALSVRVARMDRHHRTMIEIANAILENLVPEPNHRSLVGIFDALVDYTHHHFGAEEKLMTDYGYPGFEEHLRQHIALMQRTTEYRDRIRAGEIPDRADFRRFFEADLIHHFVVEDEGYASFLNSIGVY